MMIWSGSTFLIIGFVGKNSAINRFITVKPFRLVKKKNLNYEKKLQKYQIKTLYLYKFRKQVKKKENERY